MKQQSARFRTLGLTRKQKGAFSILEILVVMSIMLVVAGTSLFGLVGRSASSSLNAAGNEVVDLVNEARQNSVGNHVMTALVLVTPASDPSGNAAIDNRLFVIEQFDPASSTWHQVSRWEPLPDGVIVDSSSSSTFMKLPALLTPPTAVTYLGSSITPAAYQVFLPDGHLSGASQTPVLRLVSGHASGQNVAYTSSTTQGVPNNYYDVTINPYTGMPIIDRP